MAALAHDAVGAQLARLGAELLQDADGLADAMVARIQATVVIYGAGAVPTDELRRTCLDNVQRIFGALGRTDATATPVSRDYGRRRAREGVPLVAIMEAYRVGARVMWEHLAEIAARAATPADVTLRGASEMWLVLDTFTHDMADGFREEATAQLVDREQERSALVQALLDGALADSNLWEAAGLLRLPQRGPYVVVAASVQGLGQRAVPHAERVLGGLGIPSAWRLQHGVEFGVACLQRPAKQLDQLIGALAANAAGCAGISTPYDDLRETAQALRLARIALNSSFQDQRVVVFGRDPLATAVASAPDAMRRVASAVFASLDKIPAADRANLLQTFGAWLDNHGSTNEAARLLFVHPNTVRHRLHRLEERTGRSLSDPRAVAELSIALEVERRGTPEPEDESVPG